MSFVLHIQNMAARSVQAEKARNGHFVAGGRAANSPPRWPFAPAAVGHRLSGKVASLVMGPLASIPGYAGFKLLN